MKILQINKFYYLKGGSERYLFDLEELLKQNGHIVIPFSMQDSRNLKTDYDAFFVDKVDFEGPSLKNIVKIFYNRQAVKNLTKLILKEKPDLAHLHNIAHHLSPAIIPILKKHKIPVVQTLHDYKLICPNYRLFSRNKVCQNCRPARQSPSAKPMAGGGGKYYRCLIQNCIKGSRARSMLAMLEAYLHNSILKTYDSVDRFIAPSRFMADICAEFGVPAEKIRVVYNFLGPRLVAAETASNFEPVSGDYLLYFGRLSEEKGIEVLLGAMARVDARWKLKITGVGPDFEKLKVQSEKLKVNDRVEFLGLKFGEELENLISNAAAIVIPSLWPENMPMSMLEAMGRGKVVIASRIGGIGEVIEDGRSGFLVEPGDEAALAAAIDRLPRVDLKAIAQNARLAVAELKPQKHYQEILNIYNEVLE